MRWLMVLLATAILAVMLVPATGATRYDIVLFLTDDQRWDTLPYMPTVKALLADKGVTFSNAFVASPLCCPNRATMLTGLYPHRHGVLDNDPPDGGATAFSDAETIAVWLSQAGYRKGYFGKYLNGYSALGPYVPPGWDEWAAKQSGQYYNYTLVETGGSVVGYGSTAEDYSTTVLTKKTVEFIEGTPDNTNLFVIFAPIAPHRPAKPAPEDVGSFASLPSWRPPSYNEDDVSDKPSWVKDLPSLTTSQQRAGDELRRRQIESLQAVDRAVGEIVAALTRTNRLERTVLVFTSDNGYSWGEHRWWLEKECPYEECIRIPFIVRVPGVSARSDSRMVLTLDLAPTILRWAGGIQAPYPLPGKDLHDVIMGQSSWKRGYFLVEMLGVADPPGSGGPRFSAVRRQQWVYVEYPNGEREFYDLQRDRYQLQNVYGDPAYAKLVAEGQSLLAILKQK